MLLASALAIFLTWLVLASVLIGIGSIFLRLLTKDYSLAHAFWMGLAISVALLEIWNLLFPVTPSITILLFSLGVLGLLSNPTATLSRLRAGLQAHPWLTSLAFLIVLFVAFRSCGPCDYYDTGLYGAPAVRWITTYPAVPGIANLSGRLGINSSVFLCIAALDQGVWRHLAHHLFAGFLMAAFCITILPACFRIVRGTSASPADWFHCILAIPITLWITRSKIVGTLTDEPAAIVCLVAAGILFEAFCLKDPAEGRHSSCPSLVVAAALLALSVSFKLSAAVFALLAWCLAVGLIWVMDSTAPRRKICLLAAFASSAFILVPWCVHGIISSGYPLFPATFMGLPVDWKVPPGMAKWFAAGIRSWGRDSDAFFLADTRGFSWIAPWLNHSLRNRAAFQVPLLISLGGLAVVLLRRIRGKPLPVCRWLCMLVPALVAIVFWLVAGPDLRFAQFSIWTAAAILGTWGIVSLGSEPPGVHRAWVLAPLSALLLWCLVSFGWQGPYRALLAVKRLEPMPAATLAVRHTQSGLAVYLPVQNNQCWDAPLPCTPNFDDTLRLRDGRSLRWGFTAQGLKDLIERPWSVPLR